MLAMDDLELVPAGSAAYNLRVCAGQGPLLLKRRRN